MKNTFVCTFYPVLDFFSLLARGVWVRKEGTYKVDLSLTTSYSTSYNDILRFKILLRVHF